MPRGCPCGSCRNHSLHIQNDSGNAGRGPSGGSSWMVSWGDSLWESPGESAGGSPQGDSLGGRGIPREEGTGGRGKGGRMPRACPCGSCRNHSLQIQKDSLKQGSSAHAQNSWSSWQYVGGSSTSSGN